MRRLLLLVLVMTISFLPGAASADRWYGDASATVLGVVDAGRQPQVARRAGVGWDRVLFLWREIQPYSAGDWYLDRYLDQEGQRPAIESGLPLVAVVQATPDWAVGSLRDGTNGVPTGLDRSVNDPQNTFGQFMLRLVHTYKGRISAWIIWNEPDFEPSDNTGWYTWTGDPADFFSLTRAGYRAVKQEDPSAQVVFAPTTYFVDAIHGRDLFLNRVLREGQKDPDAPANGYYFDAVGLNVYCSLDGLSRFHSIYSEILSHFQLVKPIWLTETNCPVYNDASTPIGPDARLSTTEQAAYVIQAISVARAAGYERVGWYAMMDHDPKSGILDRYGLLRTDGSPRPAFEAFKVASHYLGRPEQDVRFAPDGRQLADGNWPLWRVVLDEPGNGRRVQVFWRSPDGPRRVRLQALAGSTATLIDVLGRTSVATRMDNQWEVEIPPSRVSQPLDPPGYLNVGDPVLLVEENLPRVRSLDPPSLQTLPR